MRAVNRLKPTKTNKDITKSGLVTSGQDGIHAHLKKTLRKHLQTPWLQPLHQPTIDVYQQLKNEAIFASGQSFILDSGCGTGKSTRLLADLYSGHIVIGVDQSLARLAKSGVKSAFSRTGNCILLRSELSTFWRLLLNDGYSPKRHCLFYPNPWPKPGHLSRRWHAHPVFPQLLCLSGEIELRCNWEIYALEFAQAVNFVSGAKVEVKKWLPESGISPFEQKYLDRGQTLYSVMVPAQITDTFRLSRLKA